MIAREEGVLDLLVAALPHLRGGLHEDSARFTAALLHDHLDLDAASIISKDRVLAFIGAGCDHHIVGEPNLTELTRRALRSGEVMRTQRREEIGCPNSACPLTSAVIAPLHAGGRVIGAIKLYRVGAREISAYDENVARSLARVLSVYLEVAELDERAALAAKAELEALRAQISPHFLFNTLTTIASLTRTNPERAHALIIDLAEFFRNALTGHGELVPLERELEYVERYLRFETARHGERLHVAYQIDPHVYAVPVPLLSVQVLVQNAVVHGIVPREGAGTVTVRAHANDGVCEVVVRDDGVGIRSGGIGSGAGVGLDNLQRRLVALFGPQHGLRIESEPAMGTAARFTVPLPS